jgi:glycosyltransferase involved in cell wall biosynthesis
MKILLIGPVYPWRGGIAHHTGVLAEHLKENHSVEIVTFSRQYPKLLFPGKSQFDVGGQPPAVPIHQWIDSINPFNWISVGFRIRNMKPDLIIFAHSLPFFGPAYGTIAAIARSSVTKVMFLCHNIIPHERRFGDVVFTRFAFAFSDYFFVLSAEVERSLLSFVSKPRYTVSPLPLYDMFGALLPKQKARDVLGISAKKVMLYFGYIRPYKGLAVLIDAMKKLESLGDAEIELLIVGEFYEDETVYRDRVKTLGLERRIRFVSGYVPSGDVASYFSAADVVVLPYLSATQSAIAQIAFHFNKPMIATNVGGLAEVVVDAKTGFLVPPNDPAVLADAVMRFYREGREEEFSKQVEIEKEKYSWSYFLQKLEALIRS